MDANKRPFLLLIYRRNTKRNWEMIDVKEQQRTIPVETFCFCKGCENERLDLHTKRLYSDDNEVERYTFAECRFRSICLHLYERLVSQFEQNPEQTETEDSTRADVLDDSDYSFCDDVSLEDRQI